MEDCNDMPPMLPPMIESKASIKLSKNTKGYNWDIKVVKDEGMTMEDVFTEIARVDLLVRGKFG